MEYQQFLYIPELPADIKVQEPRMEGYSRHDQIYSDRADVTAGLVTIYEGNFQSIVSVHSRLALAEKRAKVENANNKDPNKKWLAVPLNLKPRNLTYFSGYEMGNAETIIMFDTSEWTMEMWNRIHYHANKEVLAKHFDEGVHEFEKKKTWRGNKSLELPICKVCLLLREELYIR